jgi:hypothetical protein
MEQLCQVLHLENFITKFKLCVETRQPLLPSHFQVGALILDFALQDGILLGTRLDIGGGQNLSFTTFITTPLAELS